MLLKKIEITNFRSIKKESINFKQNFQVLVGINEAGKSNILRAVSLLNQKELITKEDIRDETHDEEPINDSKIMFVFTLDDLELNSLITEVKNKIITKNINNVIYESAGKKITLKEFCNIKREFLHTINIIKQTRINQHWSLNYPTKKILSNWKKIVKGSAFKLNINGEEKNISDYSIVNIEEFPEIPEEFYKELDFDTLNTVIGLQVVELFKGNIPNCLIWKYEEKNLLPGRVNLENFKNDPSVCIPLKNMFFLAGISDISKKITDAINKTNGLRNMLTKVGENTTSHMRKVWPEWKKIKIKLNENGNNIEAGIEDEFNFYSLDRRSDGFKRFFTFLLMISVQNKTKNIFNNIIIIDEPDIGLHPSGIKYLREELQKISQNNIVFISTHSIFMIDKEVTERHLIVEKTKEVTNIKRVEYTNVNEEEVIYNALNYSMYDMLKPVNIIFEGWRDKKIYECYKTNVINQKGKLKKETSYGLLHAMGVKDIERIACTCENFNRKYVIISDSDRVAIEKKREFKGSGKWICYSDIENVEAVTSEDLLTIKFINDSIKKVLRKENIDAQIVLNNNIGNNKLSFIKSELEKVIIEKEKVSLILNKIKEEFIDKLELKHIDKNYKKVFTRLSEEIKNIS